MCPNSGTKANGESLASGILVYDIPTLVREEGVANGGLALEALVWNQ